jgi:hypothetical protein
MATYISLKRNAASSGSSLTSLNHLEPRESLHRQRRISLGTSRDKPLRQRENLIQRQRRVKRLRERGRAELAPEIGRVSGLDGEDGPRCCEVGFFQDEGCGAEVG